MKYTVEQMINSIKKGEYQEDEFINKLVEHAHKLATQGVIYFSEERDIQADNFIEQIKNYFQSENKHGNGDFSL